MENIYLVEVSCGGFEAAGGGCGAPRGCYVENYSEKGVYHRNKLDNHSISEAGFSNRENDIENGDLVLWVRYEFRPCRECRTI